MSIPGSPKSSSSVTLTTIRVASTWSMTPLLLAVIAAPESRATTVSIPVPTNGASALSRGTAWRCMFDPISARFASSFSKKGISDAATETSCLGDTSMSSTVSFRLSLNSPSFLVDTSSLAKRPPSSRRALACAMT